MSARLVYRNFLSHIPPGVVLVFFKFSPAGCHKILCELHIIFSLRKDTAPFSLLEGLLIL